MPSMKHLLFILTVTLASGLVKGQGNHPFIKSVNLFQQEDVVVLRWVMHGGNTCHGMKVYRAENEVDFSQIGIISGSLGHASWYV